MDINQGGKMKGKVFEEYDLDLGVPLLSDSDIIDEPFDKEDITGGTVSDYHNASQPSVVPMAAALVEQARNLQAHDLSALSFGSDFLLIVVFLFAHESANYFTL